MRAGTVISILWSHTAPGLGCGRCLLRRGGREGGKEGWMSRWPILHFSLSLCGLLHRTDCICLFGRCFWAPTLFQALGVPMVNQMASPVSMNSQSSKEKRHTPLHLLEKITIMARQHYIFVCVGVCQHSNISKDNNQVDTSGREEARIWRRGDVCWCRLNFLKKIHISITQLKCNVKTK